LRTAARSAQRGEQQGDQRHGGGGIDDFLCPQEVVRREQNINESMRMKKLTSAKRGSAAKRRIAPKAMDTYIAGVPEPARSTLRKVRAAIRSAAPADATETISYQIPTFRHKGGLVAFAAFSNHCSFFPMSIAVMRALKDDLKNLDSSKGTIRFPLDKPLSAALIKKLVKARVAENERRQKR
jgi:uncharacterized protein YdhG (YjbR/CyaY superfamily)